MCYFHTHSRVMITLIFKFFYFLSVIILSIYVLDSEISKFQIYVGKLSKKVPEPDPIIVKLYLSFVRHWKHFYGSAHVHICIQVVWQEFSMLQKSRSSTQVCVGIYLLPVVPTFIYYSIICLDFLTGGTARFTLVHIPLDPVVTFPPLPMPDRDGPALFSNKYLLLPIRPII